MLRSGPAPKCIKTKFCDFCSRAEQTDASGFKWSFVWREFWEIRFYWFEERNVSLRVREGNRTEWMQMHRLSVFIRSVKETRDRPRHTRLPDPSLLIFLFNNHTPPSDKHIHTSHHSGHSPSRTRLHLIIWLRFSQSEINQSDSWKTFHNLTWTPENTLKKQRHVRMTQRVIWDDT